MNDAQVCDRLEYLRSSALPGMELLVASPSLATWRMLHERYLVCACSSAATSWVYRHKTHYVEDGSAGLMEPGEIHKVVEKRKPTHFVALFIEPGHFLKHAEEAGISRVPHFRAQAVKDTRMLRGIEQLAACVRDESEPLCLQSEFAQLMKRILSHTEGRGPIPGQPRAGLRRALLRSREILRSRYSERLTLDELAAEVALSRFHLVRSFTNEFGVSPHAFQVQVRIKYGRELLRKGAPCAEVANATGFADQSHFARHFRKIMGVTPSTYWLARRSGTPAGTK